MKNLKRVFFALLLFAAVTGMYSACPEQLHAASKEDLVLVEGQSNSTKSIVLKWKKTEGAKRYVIKGAKCEKKLKTLGKTSKNKFTYSGLKKGKTYTFIVYAQEKAGQKGKFKTIAKSEQIHVVVKGNKKGFVNPIKGQLSAQKLALRKAESQKLTFSLNEPGKGKKFLGKKHAALVRYISSDEAVAKVDANGNVTGQKAGECKIYAIAVNGLYAVCAISVTDPIEPVPEPTYTLSYKYTGEIPEDAPVLPKEAAYKAGDRVAKAEAPTLEGWDFSGWEGEVTTMPEKDVVVTGSWTRKKVTITYYFPDPSVEYKVNPDNEAGAVLMKYLKGELTAEQIKKEVPEPTIRKFMHMISYSYYSMINLPGITEKQIDSVLKLRDELVDVICIKHTVTVDYGTKDYQLLNIDDIDTFTKAWDEKWGLGGKSLSEYFSVYQHTNIGWVHTSGLLGMTNLGFFYYPKKEGIPYTHEIPRITSIPEVKVDTTLYPAADFILPTPDSDQEGQEAQETQEPQGTQEGQGTQEDSNG